MSSQTLHNIQSHDVPDTLPALVEPVNPKWMKEKINYNIIVPNLQKKSVMPDDEYDLLSSEKKLIEPKSIDAGSKYGYSGQNS